MPNVTDVIMSFNELSAELIPKLYLPQIYDVSQRRRRAWLADLIPRSSEGVNGLKVYLTFLTRLPWAWRAMSEYGYTPTGAKHDADEMNAQLGCHAASAIVSLTEIEATANNAARWTNIIDKQMQAIMKTFPYYMRALLWTSQNSKKAVGTVSSISGTTVTLDNAGLWHTETVDRCKLLEAGMYVQAYRSTAKVGSPVLVTSVNKAAGTLVVAADPGLADNDVLVLSDIGGLDQPYTTLCPGILDVIDDDNTFQGITRSDSGKEMFQSVVTDATSLTFGYEMFSDFLHSVYNPPRAFTNYRVLRKYWEDMIAENTRYTPGADVPEGYRGLSVMIDQTTLLEDDDIDSDKLIVPDFENMRLADRGGVENLFNKGWYQVPGRPFLEYVVVYWALLLAEDTRYMGLLDNIQLT